MHPRLSAIVEALARRPNPPADGLAPLQALQQAIRRERLPVTEADLAEAAARLGLDPGDLSEELASWL